MIFGAVGYGAWQYYKYTQNQIQIFAVNAAQAEQARATKRNERPADMPTINISTNTCKARDTDTIRY